MLQQRHPNHAMFSTLERKLLGQENPSCNQKAPRPYPAGLACSQTPRLAKQPLRLFPSHFLKILQPMSLAENGQPESGSRGKLGIESRPSKTKSPLQNQNKIRPAAYRLADAALLRSPQLLRGTKASTFAPHKLGLLATAVRTQLTARLRPWHPPLHAVLLSSPQFLRWLPACCIPGIPCHCCSPPCCDIRAPPSWPAAYRHPTSTRRGQSSPNKFLICWAGF